VKVGAWAPLTGSAAAYAAVEYGAQAYFEWVNHHGGVDGRHIKYTILNDGYQPQRTVADARELVQKDDVTAMVAPLGSPTGVAAMPYLKSQKIPVIGPGSGSSVWVKPFKKTYFSTQPPYFNGAETFVKYGVKHLGLKKFAVFHQNTADGKESLKGADAALKQMGLPKAVDLSYSTSDVNFSAQANKLKRNGVDAVITANVESYTATFLKDLAQVNARPQVFASYVQNDPRMFKLAGPLWKDAIVGAWLKPPTDRFKKALKAYAPSNYSKPNSLSESGWVAAQTYVKGLKKSGGDPAKVIDGLEKIKHFKPELSRKSFGYGPHDHTGVATVALERAKNGEYVPVG
jgi:ABC-type branched-subunit amino acid transport system substrate-binding protein